MKSLVQSLCFVLALFTAIVCSTGLLIWAFPEQMYRPIPAWWAMYLVMALLAILFTAFAEWRRTNVSKEKHHVRT